MTGSAYQGFSCKSTFNGDISKWDTAQVTNMYDYVLASYCVQPDIGSWDTAKVTNMNLYV